MSTNGINQQKAEAFAERMIGVLNEGAVALMTSIGHEVGLFDTMANLPPTTSTQIATAAGLHERYVREWLSAMATSRIVEHNPVAETYTLPPEHAAWLTRAAGTNNLALQTQYIPLLAQVEERIIECFRKGGGVPYAAYPRFQFGLGAWYACTHHECAVALADALARHITFGNVRPTDLS